MYFLYHHRTAGRGAEGNHIMSLVRAVEECDHTVDIVSPPGIDPRNSAGAVPLDKGASKQSGFDGMWQWMSCRAPQILFELAEIAYNAYATVRLTGAILRKRPAALYERYAFFLFAGLMVAKAFRVPLLIEVNEIAGMKRARGQILVPLAIWLEKQVFSRADAIFVVSTLLKQQVLERGACESTVHVMPNAIDPKKFILTRATGKTRDRLGLNGKTVLGFVGWFDHWDRLDVLIDAFAKIAPKYPDTSVLLVGDGPVTTLIRERISAYEGLSERVTLTGAVASREVPEYLDAMDICVLPDSSPYGSPMVLFEFMACSKPVIAPDHAPIRDVIEHGKNGLIVPPADDHAIAAALTDLLDDPKKRSAIGANGREYVMSTRTWAANATRVLGTTRELILAGAQRIG